MQSFVVRPMAWLPLRPFSRNPLIRASDRIEAAAATLAVLAVIVAAACAGTLGTMVHDANAHVYAGEARTRHAVVATALAEGVPAKASPLQSFTVQARWQLNGTAYTRELDWDTAVKAGDPLQIWVNDAGNRVDPPSPASRAATEAVLAAVFTFVTAVLFIAGGMACVRWRVGDIRAAQWQRDIRCLVGNHGERNDNSH